MKITAPDPNIARTPINSVGGVSVSSLMANPMTTAADLIVGGTAGAPTRLAKGADGQVLTVNASTHLLDWETPGGSSSPLTTKGDLYGHSTVDARIPIGSDTQVLTADSTQALGLKWAAASGGGGVTHTYYGHNSIGASNEAVPADDVWTLKKFTLSAAGYIAEIQIYLLPQGTDHVLGFNAMLHNDNAGAVGSILTAPIYVDSFHWIPYPSVGGAGTNGWYGLPLAGVWAVAGDYWVSWAPGATSLAVNVAYDTSGSDQRYTSGGHWGAAGVYYSTASTTKNYSVRVGVLS